MTETIDPGETVERYGVVPRPLVSTGETTETIEPDGDGTLQAIQRRLPYIVEHDTAFQVTNGDFAGEGPAIHLGPVFVKGSAHLTIAGNTDDPSMVNVDAGINLTAFGKVEHIQVRGMTLNGLTQVCGMALMRELYISGNETCAIDGKGGLAEYRDCDIGDQSSQFGAYPNDMMRLFIKSSTIRGSEAAFHGPMGTEIATEFSSLGEQTDRASRHHRRLRDGVYRGGRRLAFDG